MSALQSLNAIFKWGNGMKQINITGNEAGQRLNKFLKKYLNQAPDSFLYKMLRKKNITLNGKKAAGDEILASGDMIIFFLSDDTIQKFTVEKEVIAKEVVASEKSKAEYKQPLSVIYENSHVIILNKPAGLLSQKAEINDISLNELLLAYLADNGKITEEELKTFRPAVCNRLDRNTSGLVIAGKTLYGLQTMSKLLHDRELHKYYRCVVKGRISEKQNIKAYLKKDEKTNTVTVYKNKTEDADYIETEYTPVIGNKEITLLEVKLVTGRTHQIRAHLAHIGHPIIGDSKYGDKKCNLEWKKKCKVNSQLLHSYRIIFPEMQGELSNMSGLEVKADVPWNLEIDKILNNMD